MALLIVLCYWIVPTRGNKVWGDLLLGLLMLVAIVVLETDVVAL